MIKERTGCAGPVRIPAMVSGPFGLRCRRGRSALGWRAVYYVWPVDKILVRRHLVDLAVDEVSAGTLSSTGRLPE
jgi:hypothetical protein